jgi:hypothetical protein
MSSKIDIQEREGEYFVERGIVFKLLNHKS